MRRPDFASADIGKGEKTAQRGWQGVGKIPEKGGKEKKEGSLSSGKGTREESEKGCCTRHPRKGSEVRGGVTSGIKVP